MAEDLWNPEQYEKFKCERAQPFWDLAALVRPAPKMRVVDLGCGTGELTAALHQRLGASETLGLDSSEVMLRKSAAFATEGLRFSLGDLRGFSAEAAWDLVFSNAALHWVDDHPARLIGFAEQGVRVQVYPLARVSRAGGRVGFRNAADRLSAAAAE